MFNWSWPSFSWSDLWGGLGALTNLGGFGLGVYNMFNRPSPNMYQPPTQGGSFGYPGGGIPKLPDFSGIITQFNEAVLAQQEALKQEQQKGLARSATAARKALQSQGITWDPENPEIGAGGVEAIASQLGIPPEELLAALKQYGDDGFQGFGVA